MIVSLILVVGPSLGFGADESGSGAAADPAPTGAQELDSLVALIALYPDPLVAQVLSASTFPDQVAIADYWLQKNKSLSGQALMQAVDIDITARLELQRRLRPQRSPSPGRAKE